MNQTVPPQTILPIPINPFAEGLRGDDLGRAIDILLNSTKSQAHSLIRTYNLGLSDGSYYCRMRRSEFWCNVAAIAVYRADPETEFAIAKAVDAVVDDFRISGRRGRALRAFHCVLLNAADAELGRDFEQVWRAAGGQYQLPTDAPTLEKIEANLRTLQRLMEIGGKIIAAREVVARYLDLVSPCH